MPIGSDVADADNADADDVDNVDADDADNVDDDDDDDDDANDSDNAADDDDDADNVLFRWENWLGQMWTHPCHRHRNQYSLRPQWLLKVCSLRVYAVWPD